MPIFVCRDYGSPGVTCDSTSNRRGDTLKEPRRNCFLTFDPSNLSSLHRRASRPPVSRFEFRRPDTRVTFLTQGPARIWGPETTGRNCGDRHLRCGTGGGGRGTPEEEAHPDTGLKGNKIPVVSILYSRTGRLRPE